MGKIFRSKSTTLILSFSLIICNIQGIKAQAAEIPNNVTQACTDGIDSTEPITAPLGVNLLPPVTDGTETDAYAYEGILCKSQVAMKGGFYRGQNSFSVTYCSDSDGYSKPISIWGQNWITNHKFITGLATGKISVSIASKDKGATNLSGLTTAFARDWFTVAIGRIHYGNYAVKVNFLGGSDDRFIQSDPVTFETHNFSPSFISGVITVKSCGINKLDVNFSQQYDPSNPNGFNAIANIIWENSSGESPCDSSASYQFTLYDNLIIPKYIDPCTFSIKISKPGDLVPPRPAKPHAYWINLWETDLEKKYLNYSGVISRSTYTAPLPAPIPDPLQLQLSQAFNKILTDPNGLTLAARKYAENPKNSGTCKIVVDLSKNMPVWIKAMSESYSVARTDYANVGSQTNLIYSNLVVRTMAMGAQMASILVALGAVSEALPAWLAAGAISAENMKAILFWLDAINVIAGIFQTWRSANAEGKLDQFDATLNAISAISSYFAKTESKARDAELALAVKGGYKATSDAVTLGKTLSVIGNAISIFKGYMDMAAEVETLKKTNMSSIKSYDQASSTYNKALLKTYDGLTQLNQGLKGCPNVTIGVKATSPTGDTASIQKMVNYRS